MSCRSIICSTSEIAAGYSNLHHLALSHHQNPKVPSQAEEIPACYYCSTAQHYTEHSQSSASQQISEAAARPPPWTLHPPLHQTASDREATAWTSTELHPARFQSSSSQQTPPASPLSPLFTATLTSLQILSQCPLPITYSNGCKSLGCQERSAAFQFPGGTSSRPRSRYAVYQVR